MPPDTIIASLKQGNALELEFIKKLRDGLDVIADGMQAECYKRGDALDELREMLEGVNLVSAYVVGLEGVWHLTIYCRARQRKRRATRVPAEAWLLFYGVGGPDCWR
jgi:hypothetical protein